METQELPEGALERLAIDLNQAKTKAEFQSVQCLWLRATLKLSADQVAIAIGWHRNSVRKLQARYFKEGESALILSCRLMTTYDMLFSERRKACGNPRNCQKVLWRVWQWS
jgi:hypothetical protein